MTSFLAGRYELETVIAQGGMGTVYKGLDTRLHRPVAIKVLKEHLAADDRFVERFRREARAVASLGHPNIASLYDYAEDDGKHFIVMELVDGTDLATLLRTSSPLGAERSKAITEQVCDALEHAHSAGIVHRDMKPGNVLVTPDGDVKVTDFGIARAAGDSTLTATGSILGTAHYLAPEQAAGKEVTPATDIYATGVMLFEMLTGTVPFEADSPVAVATRHVNEEVPAPSALEPTVPLELDAVVLRATAKDPKDRFVTAAEMAAALRASFSGAEDAPTEVVSAPITATAPLPLLTRPYGRRAAWVVGLLALLALGLLAFRLVTGPDDGRGDPAAGDKARKGEVRSMPIPEVLGLPVDEATAQLTRLGFRVEVEGDPAGIVADVSPPVDSEVRPGTPVTLTGTPLEEPVEDDDEKKDEEEPDEGGPPPHAEGKGKDKDKEKGKEKKDK